jgi:hypothetical protein
MDYALETNLQIGRDACAHVAFDGKIMRWINATPECDATLSISVASLKDHRVENEIVSRFLSLLAWDHDQAVRIKFAAGGGRTPYSKAFSSRGPEVFRVDPVFSKHLFTRKLNKHQRLALGIYREAMNASSTFYEFLSYYKILELALPTASVRRKWLGTIAVPRLSYLGRLKEILSQHSDLELYLREQKLNGIKHAIKMTINTDSPDDQLATNKDNLLMEQIARLVMREKLDL